MDNRERWPAAVLDRLVHGAYEISMEGESSMRRKRAKRSKKGAKAEGNQK